MHFGASDIVMPHPWARCLSSSRGTHRERRTGEIPTNPHSHPLNLCRITLPKSVAMPSYIYLYLYIYPYIRRSQILIPFLFLFTFLHMYLLSLRTRFSFFVFAFVSCLLLCVLFLVLMKCKCLVIHTAALRVALSLIACVRWLLCDGSGQILKNTETEVLACFHWPTAGMNFKLGCEFALDKFLQ